MFTQLCEHLWDRGVYALFIQQNRRFRRFRLLVTEQEACLPFALRAAVACPHWAYVGGEDGNEHRSVQHLLPGELGIDDVLGEVKILGMNSGDLVTRNFNQMCAARQ